MNVATTSNSDHQLKVYNQTLLTEAPQAVAVEGGRQLTMLQPAPYAVPSIFGTRRQKIQIFQQSAVPLTMKILCSLKMAAPLVIRGWIRDNARKKETMAGGSRKQPGRRRQPDRTIPLAKTRRRAIISQMDKGFTPLIYCGICLLMRRGNWRRHCSRNIRSVSRLQLFLLPSQFEYFYPWALSNVRLGKHRATI